VRGVCAAWYIRARCKGGIVQRRLLIAGAVLGLAFGLGGALVLGAPAGRSAARPLDAGQATAATSGATSGACNRDCLYGFVDQYVTALVAKDPSSLPLAKTVKYTENNVAMKIGDGLWNTATGIGQYKLKFADTATGQVVLMGTIQETKSSSLFGVRLKIKAGKITEAETLVNRTTPGTPALEHYIDKPVLDEMLVPGEQSSRKQMIALANGYFDTLQQNDGTLHTQFDDNCNREENGLRSTNNPDSKIFPVTALGCADQFKTGYFRYDDRVRQRRFMVIDQERGLLLANGFIDHSGKIGIYKLTDGRVLDSPMRTPSSLCLFELFKIKNGKILQIEVIMVGVPYNTPSAWIP
jgi:hypothetical protein